MNGWAFATLWASARILLVFADRSMWCSRWFSVRKGIPASSMRRMRGSSEWDTFPAPYYLAGRSKPDDAEPEDNRHILRVLAHPHQEPGFIRLRWMKMNFKMTRRTERDEI